MSTLSEAKKLLKGSERESVINYKAVATLAFAAMVGYFFLQVLAGRQVIPDSFQAARAMPEATIAFVEPTQTPTRVYVGVEATVTPWPTPIIIVQEKIVEVEVTREVAYYVTEYIEAPVILPDPTSTPVPTATVVPLAAGNVKVCASVEGATALYIGGEGVVSGQCKIYSFGVGQTSIQVQVNR